MGPLEVLLATVRAFFSNFEPTENLLKIESIRYQPANLSAIGLKNSFSPIVRYGREKNGVDKLEDKASETHPNDSFDHECS